MNSESKKTYLFIPGGWHGAWAYDPITARLEGADKQCFALTLPGLETEPVKYERFINLDTHIQFVVDFIVEGNLTDVILCGHSYAGMVIAGVADRIAERIETLVFIDAYIPKNGDSCWKLTSDSYRTLFANGAEADGFTVAAKPGTDKRRRPHPLATFMQSIALKANYEQIRNRVFIYLNGWEDSPFQKQYEDLKNDETWRVETINCEHNIMLYRPDELTSILKTL